MTNDLSRRVRRLLVAPAALGGLAVAGTVASTVASVVAVRGLGHGRTHGPETVPHRPVALVLGAQVFTDGTPSPFLAARLDLAHRLYAAGRVDHLLLSGDGAAREYDEPAAMRRHLRALGMPDGAMTDDPFGLDTYDSCWRARHVHGFRSLTVVTQAYHLPRALGTARALGLDVVGVGDTSVRRLRRSWRKGVVRELPACVKAAGDLLSRRPARVAY